LLGIFIDAINTKTCLRKAGVTKCLSELKSAILSELNNDNVTVDNCRAGLVPNVGRQQNFNFLTSEKIIKGEKQTISSF
jgi:hypothetical protein